MDGGNSRSIEIYDTTLRDGAQQEGISFSVEDKLRIARRLDALGVRFIEGGWPGANPKDSEFFQRAGEVRWKNATLVAFGSTCRVGKAPEEDATLAGLLAAGTPVVTIFGKAWDLHVTEALQTTLEENLRLVSASVAYLRQKGRRVIFDAEHFFDGYRNNPAYALQVLQAAAEAGAETIVLCDTNGGSLASQVQAITAAVRRELGEGVRLGIHAHNDSAMAVASSVAAVEAGADHVQGTINGYGERCGNADLCALIPILQLKMGCRCVAPEELARLTEVSRYVSEIANLSPFPHQPFVGSSAFAHKGGVHVSAVLKHPATYEHIQPELVGNRRRVLISEQAGVSNILYKAAEYDLHLEEVPGKARTVLETVKLLEHQGYSFEGAEASFELLLRRALGLHQPLFDLLGFRLIIEKREQNGEPLAEATLKLRVGERIMHTAAEGDGPVNALDNALRKALEEVYPRLKEIRLSDFKVRVLDGQAGTAAKVRVLIETRDQRRTWGTVGVSTNIIEASWRALVDSFEYALTQWD